MVEIGYTPFGEGQRAIREGAIAILFNPLRPVGMVFDQATFLVFGHKFKTRPMPVSALLFKYSLLVLFICSHKLQISEALSEPVNNKIKIPAGRYLQQSYLTANFWKRLCDVIQACRCNE